MNSAPENVMIEVSGLPIIYFVPVAKKTLLTDEATPESNEELEDQFGGWAAGVQASVLLKEAGGRVGEAGVGAVQASL